MNEGDTRMTMGNDVGMEGRRGWRGSTSCRLARRRSRRRLTNLAAARMRAMGATGHMRPWAPRWLGAYLRGLLRFASAALYSPPPAPNPRGGKTEEAGRRSDLAEEGRAAG